MSKLRSNIFSNLLGQGWGALVQLVALPIYIKLLGIEAYGLIAFYVTLQVTIQAFDFGLGQTLNRELARLGPAAGEARRIRDTVRTIEVVFLSIVTVAGVLLFLLAPVLGEAVIKPDGLDPGTVGHVMQLMAVLLPIQWAAAIFQAGLMGLEKQVLINGLRVAFVTFGTVIAILLLYFVSPTLATFFWWQIVVAVIYLLTVSLALHRALPPSPAERPAFRMDILRDLKGFAVGMGGISIAGVVFSHLDRWILISIADLKVFGYYSVAIVVASALYLFITPIFNGLFPRFTGLIARDQRAELLRLYALGTQLMVGMVMPPAIVLSLFSWEIILAWTRNPELASQAAPIASIFVLGTAVNGVMCLPFAIQLASGWSRLALALVTMLILVFVPTAIALTLQLGALGCALAWFLLHALYLLVGTHLTHVLLIPGAEVSWFTRNVFPGLLAALAVILPGWALWPAHVESMLNVLLLVAVTGLAMLAACWAGSDTRKWLMLRLA